MMTFRTFVSESPDDVYMNENQATFFYFARESDITNQMTDWIEEEVPGITEAITRSVREGMAFPCVVVSSPKFAGGIDVALVPMLGTGKRMISNSGTITKHKLRTHSLLLDTLLYELVGAAVARGLAKATGRNVIDFLSLLDERGEGDDGQKLSERSFGVAGRFTDVYFSTWKPMEFHLVTRVMDAMESTRLYEFKDTVAVETTGDDGEIFNARRKPSGRFS